MLQDLKTQVKELQSALHGTELVADDNKDAAAKLQERLGKATKVCSVTRQPSIC